MLQNASGYRVHISLVEIACKPFHKGIHYLFEIFQDAIYYIRANYKYSPIAACKFLSKISVFIRVLDIILKFA